jgi:hypothetical protein
MHDTVLPKPLSLKRRKKFGRVCEQKNTVEPRPQLLTYKVNYLWHIQKEI